MLRDVFARQMGQQGIGHRCAASGLPDLCAPTQTLIVARGDLPPDPDRKRRRQDDRRAAVHRVQSKQGAELLLHIGVEAMRLVDDENAAGQRILAKGQMLLRQNGQERLIDSAGADIGEEGAAPVVGDPSVATRGGRFLAVAAGSRRQARQRFGDFGLARARGSRTAISLPGSSANKTRRDLFETLVHRIGGRHGRQGEIDSFAKPGLDHARRQQKRGFGLARSGRVLDKDQLRACAERQLFREALHRTR